MNTVDESKAGANAALRSRKIWASASRRTARRLAWIVSGVILSLASMLPGWAAVDPLDTWHIRTLPGAPFTEDLNSVAFGKGLFVIGGDDGSIFSSSDGADWHREVSPVTKSIDDIVFAQDRFVAVGSGQVLLTSEDGRAWTKQVSPMSGADNVLYDGARFVTLEAGGFVHVSTDGVQWASASGVPTSTVSVGGIAFGNGVYVEAGYKSGAKAPDLFSSPDLKTWTPRTANVNQNLMNVGFGLGLFVAVGQKGALATSPDGFNWTARATPHTGFIWDVSSDGRTLVAAAQWGRLLSSTNGADWKVHETGLPWHLKAVAFGKGTFLAVGWDGQVVQSDPVASVPPDEAVVLSVPAQSGSGFTFQFTGKPGNVYQVLASPDLNQWSPIATVQCTQSPMPFADPVPGASKWYRVVRL